MQLVELPYSQVRPILRDGDIALFRGKTFFAWILKKAGSGQYSHVGCIGRNEDAIDLIEVREFVGGRVINFDEAIKVYNGQIDIYRPIESLVIPRLIIKDGLLSEETETIIYDGKLISECMRALAGVPYDWSGIFKLSTIHLAILRLWYRDDQSLFEDKPRFAYNKYFCSDAMSKCLREKFYDAVKNRSDKGTDPSDLSRSPLLNYFCTPIWGE